ncbi:MAG: GatB/YqeY domain-containing protein [Gammaproteobacteria bacterium]|nr:GatB/YqeY domain-containing protein [Gammaproteobacteria bacterium]MCP5139988.1 GatB/YqeY domain-containing protein [Chromatiales bacterium]
MLKAQIQEDMKSSMRAGDKSRLSVVRMLLAAIKQREVDERTETTDAAVLQIIEKQIRQRRESATQFTAGGRADLADKEISEIAVLQTWLPSALSAEELDTLIDEVMTASAATTMKDMGRVMAALRERAQGRADFGAIGERVKARLSGK